MNEACRFTKKGEIIYRLRRMLLDEYGQGSVYSSVDELLKKIENTVLDCRSFDVVEVVRCGECEYLYTDGKCDAFADFSIRPSASDFCSYGKRRE